MNLYQRINGADWCNIFVVGDLHGCNTLLMNELDKVSFDPARDLLISVGDLVDRGAENVECLDLITMPWFRAVRGNHEQMMLDALVNGGSFGHWMSNGSGWWHQLDSEQDVQLKYLLPKVTNLPMIIELVTGNKKVVICHADYPHNEYCTAVARPPRSTIRSHKSRTIDVVISVIILLPRTGSMSRSITACFIARVLSVRMTCFI